MSVAVQSDGKIVAGVDMPSVFSIVRYNPDGSLDSTFGSSGIVTAPQMGRNGDQLVKAWLEPDSKIIAVGYSNNGNHYRAEVTRFDTNGSLDSSWGGSGIIIADLGPSVTGGISDSSGF